METQTLDELTPRQQIDQCEDQYALATEAGDAAAMFKLRTQIEALHDSIEATRQAGILQRKIESEIKRRQEILERPKRRQEAIEAREFAVNRRKQALKTLLELELERWDLIVCIEAYWDELFDYRWFVSELQRFIEHSKGLDQREREKLIGAFQASLNCAGNTYQERFEIWKRSV